MAGIHRQRLARLFSPGRVTVRSGRIQVEQLEDRTAPAIIQQGLPTWLEAGPAPIANTDFVTGIGGQPPNNGVGAVEALAQHPTNPDILFAAATSGGLWRTTNATAPSPDWTPLTDQAPTLAIGTLSMNPANPNQLLVGFGQTASTFFATTDLPGAMLVENATGMDANGQPVQTTFRVLSYPNLVGHSFRSSVYGPGYMLLGSQIAFIDGSGRSGEVFRSLDGGATFVSLSGQGGLPPVADVAGGTPVNGSDVFQLVADPADMRRVYAVTKTGVFRTENILEAVPTWVKVDAAFQGFGSGIVNAKLAIHNSAAGNILYLGVVDSSGALGNISWSSDRGTNWTQMDNPEILDNPIGITDVNTASPIQITTAFNHGFVTGQRVFVSGVQGNLEANGVWTITVNGQQTFTLDGSTATGVYTGGGQVQAIGGINSIGQGALHFALAADPSDSNLLYIAGDANPATVSGSVLRGNRSVPRSNGFIAPTPQWTLITDSGAASNGAPHSDTRYLAISPGSNLQDPADDFLLDANDGGVYRQLAPRTNSGQWVSVNGDLGVAQMYTGRWDPLNNVVFGGFQDMGNFSQGTNTTGAPQGNTVWDGTDPLGGDGFLSDVDATSVPGTTTRYWLHGNSSFSVLRQTYDANNLPVGGPSFMNLADIASPNKFASGYDAADKTAGFFMRLALNSVDPRLVMIGGAKLYEDNDPDPGLGQTGDVIAKVTPTGMAGRVSSIVYGGKVSGQSVPRIAYIGTTGDQVFVRGPAGPFYQSTLPALPTSALGGTVSATVTDIAVDPDDWSTSYLLRTVTDTGDPALPFDTRTYSILYMNTQGGLPDGTGKSSWVDITGNLVGSKFDTNGNLTDGLSTRLKSIAVWDPAPGTPDGNEVLLAAGHGGVFRRVPGLTDPTLGGGDWTEYGLGMPNVTVSDITIQGNHLTAATLGRGAWVIPDVSGSIATKAELIVRGNPSANRMTIQADPSNPAAVVVNDGLGSSLRVDRQSVQIFRFEGLGGADTIELAANGAKAGDLSFVKFILDVDAGGDPGDTLLIRDVGRTAASRTTVTSTTVGSTAGDTLFGGAGATVRYTGLAQGNLVLDLGPDAIDGNQVFVQSSAAFSTRIIGSSGADEVHVGSQAGTNDFGDLSGLGGGIAFDGRVASMDTFVVSDFAAATGNAAVFVNGGTVTGFAGPTDAAPVSFTNAGTVRLLGSNSAGLGESFRVQGPNAPVFEVFANNGPDEVSVRSLQQIVNVDAGDGNDTIRVSSFAGDSDDGSLAGVLGKLYVEGGAGDNRMVVSDFANPVGSAITLTSGSIEGATRNPIRYAATGGRFISGGGDGLLVRGSNAGDDVFTVVSSLANSQTAADGLGGNDVFNVFDDSTKGDVVLRGSGGNDRFNVNPGFTGGVQNTMRLSGGAGNDIATVYGLTTADDFATVRLFDATNGQVAGVGAAVDFDSQERVVFDGSIGRNNLTIVDATGGRYGSPTNPGSGIVYAPTNETSGEVRVGGGTVGPVIEFRAINGKDDSGLVLSGDPTGNAPDVLTILATSEDGQRSALGEPTAQNGTDRIDVTDRLVTLSNQSRGFLRTIALGRAADGRPTFTTLVVQAGNETGAGDRITVTPSTEVNILIDGGSPGNRVNGDTLSVNTSSAQKFQIVDDPALGPRHTRVVTADGASAGFLNIEGTLDPETGFTSAGLRSIYAVSADVGGGPRVAVYDAATKGVLYDGFIYDPSFRGGVRVATGDVTGDGIPDVITVAGVGGGPHVQVLDGVTFQSVTSFFAYEPSYRGGLYVTAADVTGDGVAEIITGTGLGGGPLVKVFDGTGRPLTAFFAFESSFRGGVRVGAGDVSGDGIADIVTAAGIGGGPLVRAFDGVSGRVLTEFLTDDPSNRSGLFVAAGDLDGDGVSDIVVGSGGNSAPDVKVRRSTDGALVRLGVFDVGVIAAPGALPAITTDVTTAIGSTAFEDGGVRVAVTSFDPTRGPAQVLAARGAGSPARIHAYSLNPIAEVGNFLAFEGFSGGVFVG